MISYRSLRSGTGIRGTAQGENAALTPDAVSRIAGAFTQWLRDKGVPLPRIAVGRDPRLSGEALERAAAEGCRMAGAAVECYGLCTTPAMYMSLITEGFACDGAVMITAGQEAADRNGLVFFTPEGEIAGETADEILDIAESARPLNGGGPEIQERDYMPVYVRRLEDCVRRRLDTDKPKPLLGLHVIVDAGNGAGGFYAKMLEDLGAWIEGSRYPEPDGRFPNHVPDPENADALRALGEAVAGAGADLGVIFDAGCGRAAIADRDGQRIGGNRLIALLSAILLGQEPGATVVTDSLTSSGVARFIQEWGGVHYRFKRGSRNIIAEAGRLNSQGISCPLAVDTRGHAALRENHFLDDGTYLATVLICEAMRLKQEGSELTSLLEGLREPIESAEVRLNIPAPDFRAAGTTAITQVMDHAVFAPGWHIAPDNREGVRITFDLDGERDSGWFLLRLSLRDPVLPLNLESDVKGGVKRMARQLLEVLEKTGGIDLTALRAFAAEA